MTTSEVLDAIERERTRLMNAVDALEGRVETAPVTEEGWTAKDVLAHLIHWATQIAFGLGAQVKPPVYMMEERKRRDLAGMDASKMPSGDESNALAVAYYRERPLIDVRTAFGGVVDLLTEQTRLRTDEQMNAVGAIPWAGPRPLWEVIAGDTFMHWPVHAEAIERATSLTS